MASAPGSLSQPVHEVSMRFDVKVSMRDGVALSTDIYLPAMDQPVPMVLIRTPYNNNNEAIVHDCMYFATRGYGVATQDVRGRWDSDGDWYPFVHEAEDGFDTMEWIGQQPWCNGNIGTAGGSYVAMVQWQAAPLRSRFLKAMVPRVGYSDFYHNWVYTGGAFQLAFNLRLGRRSDVHPHEPGAVPVAARGEPPEHTALAFAAQHHGRQGGPRLAGVAGLDRAPGL